MALPPITYVATFTTQKLKSEEKSTCYFDHKIVDFSADKWRPFTEGVSSLDDKALIIAHQINEASLQTLPRDLLMENSYALQVGQLLAKRVSKAEDLPFTPRKWAVILDAFQKIIKPPESLIGIRSLSVDLRIEDAKNELATFIYSKEQRGFFVPFKDEKIASGVLLKEGKVALVNKEAKPERLSPPDLEYAWNYSGTMELFVAHLSTNKPPLSALEKAARFCIDAIKKRHKQKLAYGNFGLRTLYFKFLDSSNHVDDALFSTLGKCKEFSKSEEYCDIQNLIEVLKEIYARHCGSKVLFQKHLLEIFKDISSVEIAFNSFIQELKHSQGMDWLDLAKRISSVKLTK